MLELDPGAEHLHGRLTVASGETQEFDGWLGLATAIERLLEPDERASHPDPTA
jgi:hypothetical protein